MKAPCEIIRDLLPLYADDVCSPASRAAVDEHLRECPACEAYLNQLRAGELENGLREEKDQVLQHQAKRFKRRSELVGTVIAAVFMVPILVSLIVNLASGHVLGWFFIVVAAMIVAASLVVVPLLVAEDRLFWTFCAFTASLMVLLATCCLYTGGDWFFVAGSAVLFGLAVLGLPFAVRAKPLQKWIAGRNKVFLVIAVDVILFANMMNMITLHSKGFLYNLGLGVLCLLGIGFLAAAGWGEEKDK